MTSETLMAELVAALAGLGGLLVFLFRWLINTLAAKLDRAVTAIERFDGSMREMIAVQRAMHDEIRALRPLPGPTWTVPRDSRQPGGRGATGGADTPVRAPASQKSSR